jgi:hypothetical protein
LCAELRGAQPADDEDVLRGILRGRFDGLPAKVKELKIEDQLLANGFADVQSLELLEAADMEELGILRGHAKLVLLVVRDSAAAGYQELPQQPQQPQQTEQPPQQQGQKQRPAGLRAFPQPAESGWPALDEWSAYQLGFPLHVGPMVSEEALELLRRINADPTFKVPASWPFESEDNAVIAGELINGPGGMPSLIVGLLDEEHTEANAGVQIYSHVTRQVKAASRAALASKLKWFGGPPALPDLEKRRHMLSVLLQEWKTALRQLVRQKAPQADAQQCLSLDTMTAQLVEVQAGLRIVDSRHLGEDVPAAEYLAVVESAAATYSSVKQQQVAMSAMSAYSMEPGLPADQLRDTSTITCRFWSKGTCWKGKKCKFHHEGKPGVKFPSGFRDCIAQTGSRGARQRRSSWSRSISESENPIRAESRLKVASGTAVIARWSAVGPEGSKPRKAAMSASMEEQFDSWFAKKVAGVAAALCVTAEEAEGMLLAAFQDLQVNNNCADGGSGAVHVVVADTGATVRVIGHTDTHRAVNITDLRRPVKVQGAGGLCLSLRWVICLASVV